MEYLITCPHCLDYIIVKKINCGVFRHGMFIKTNKQINPHASKKSCDKYIKNKEIYGCGKPYHIVKEGDVVKAIVCDYL